MTGDQTTTESKSFIPAADSETTRRLKDIETALSSLQDTKQKTEDDISEIKQWRDNFVAEQSDMGINIDNLSKKQKQNFKNIRKQIHEEDSRMHELNNEIKIVKERETKTDKAIEKLFLDLREFKIHLQNINTEMQANTEKIENFTQEFKKHYDWISTVQEEGTKHHVVICKLLQQKFIPIDKMIQTYNHNSKCMEGRLKKVK
ncbi:uncharacterized protein LOC131957623 [Physella acuta]|uniref:uncharacterized protein LOC131957623 n=1 Tax=Physella acuta TaxID=109671 RepID=UPI0027DD9AD7|nr:uncharacterized protein LOC131957623 [Physella acuta]